jgi:hypothetical protein
MMKRLQFCTGVLIWLGVASLAIAQAQNASPVVGEGPGLQKARQQATAATATPVVGGGTSGQLTKWLGTDGASFTLGNSIITEDKFGLIGIGTTAPTSKLTVKGMIETTLGGYKFPDGSLQTTAGLSSVFHDATLAGNGKSGTPLRVAVPLILSGAPNNLNAIVSVFSIGSDPIFGGGGTAILGLGGDSPDYGGTGVYAEGGKANGAPGFGGSGVFAKGGFGAHGGGSGVSAMGGGGTPGDRGGDGVTAKGGIDSGIGVRAEGGFGNQSVGGIGVLAQGGMGGGFPQGFEGGIGVWAQGGSGIRGDGLAGKFVGNVDVTGTLSKGAGSFKIDHPLDPENKYLYHSFVESPEMMNIYNGNVTTDENGDATVTLPEWFESLNKDFRYQLTVIGQFAQAIVASEVIDHHFAIKTSAANVKVSWQVTGVRQDAYAKAHRIKVEEDKPERERGYYLHPEVFNQPEEKSVEWARQPLVMKEMKRQQLKEEQKRSAPNQ